MIAKVGAGSGTRPRETNLGIAKPGVVVLLKAKGSFGLLRMMKPY